MRTLRAHPESGRATSQSTYDRIERTFGYRKLPRYDVYVVASFATPSVIGAWIDAMSRHLIFGIPATVALVMLATIALRRTRRLEREVVRRENTELALRQAQKMEAVGRLSGGIAHDFNNMLTVILGNIDMALRRLDDNSHAEQPARMHRLLDSARQASVRAAMLVQRLLAFSRQHPQEVKAVDINRLVQGMSELLRRTIGEVVVIETVLAGGLWKIAVDPNQLENAIVNLAVNARDAMPNGGRLTIETANSYLDESYVSAHASDMTHGQYVLVALSDTGSGMSHEVIERAFEPFFTTKPTGMGTGLGLSMVYGFAKQSNGHIKIYSELGEGTTIKLYFPRLSEQRALPSWSGDERAAPREATPMGRETLLLVEDDPEVQRFSADVLREAGYQVHTASNGADALRIIDSEPAIQMLFTDVVLPGGMNGRQLADEVRRRRPELKVLYATGYTRNAIIHHGRLDADVELLTKPFTADALARKVRDILDGRPAIAPAATNAPTNGISVAYRRRFHWNLQCALVTIGTNRQRECSSPVAGASRSENHVRRCRPRHVPVAPRETCSRRRHQPLHRCVLRLRRNLHGLRRCLPLRARHRAPRRLHAAQSRLRGGVQRHRQHHGARQQGRPPAVARSSACQLHRVLPRLRVGMRQPLGDAPALPRLRGRMHGLRGSLHRHARRHADAGLIEAEFASRALWPSCCRSRTRRCPWCLAIATIRSAASIRDRPRSRRSPWPRCTRPR